MPQLIVVSFHVLKRECARAQLLSWHSHIRGGKWTLHFFFTFLVFLDLLSCFHKLFANLSHFPTGQLQRQHQRLRWQAASSPLSHAHVQLQRQDDRSQPSEGRGGGSVKTNGLEKKLKLEADGSERQTDRFPCLCAVFLHTFLHAIGPSNRMATQSLPPCEPRQ